MISPHRSHSCLQFNAQSDAPRALTRLQRVACHAHPITCWRALCQTVASLCPQATPHQLARPPPPNATAHVPWAASPSPCLLWIAQAPSSHAVGQATVPSPPDSTAAHVSDGVALITLVFSCLVAPCCAALRCAALRCAAGDESACVLFVCAVITALVANMDACLDLTLGTVPYVALGKVSAADKFRAFTLFTRLLEKRGVNTTAITITLDDIALSEGCVNKNANRDRKLFTYTVDTTPYSIRFSYKIEADAFTANRVGQSLPCDGQRVCGFACTVVIPSAAASAGGANRQLLPVHAHSVQGAGCKAHAELRQQRATKLHAPYVTLTYPRFKLCAPC